MPEYNYECERKECGKIITVSMTFTEREAWLEKKSRRKGNIDFIHHEDCPTVGTADILPRAYRVFVGKNKKPVPVIFGEGFTKSNDLN